MKFFQISKSHKTIFQKAILSFKFKFPANNSKLLLAGNLNFKLRIVFWNIFFWDLEIWKNFIALSEKKPPLQKSDMANDERRKKKLRFTYAHGWEKYACFSANSLTVNYIVLLSARLGLNLWKKVWCTFEFWRQWC